MLSHCVPDALGPADRARAWQLLREVGRSHAVCLACVADGPFDWAQWRAVEAQTLRLAIGPATHWQWSPAPDLRLAMPAISAQRTLRPALSAWLRQINFDLVISTHLSLWPDAAATPAPRHACDLEPCPSLMHQRLAESAPTPERYWRHRLAAACAAQERALAQACDLTILGVSPAPAAAGFQPESTALLPLAADSAQFARLAGDARTSSAADEPCVLIHGDWRFGAARRDLRNFLHRAWPRIQRALPGAKWVAANGYESLLRSPHLRRRAIMVCPTGEPSIGRWPVVQALALGASVIADRRAATGLGASASLRLAEATEWGDLCVEALRAPRVVVAQGIPFPASLAGQASSGRPLFLSTDPRPIPLQQPALARAA
jgi:hypothetical protein